MTTLSRKFTAFFYMVAGSDSFQLVTASILVGLLSGAGVWIFKRMIDWVQRFTFDGMIPFLSPLGHWTIILAPALGGLVVGLWVKWWIGPEKYHGMPGIIEACALAGGKLPFIKMPARIIGAAISIGSGASVGPEDPSVQIGANIGSMLGRWVRFSEDRVRGLVAAGAAAGVAAAFNAPIAGVFFAIEILLGELSSSSFAVAAIAAVSSTVFTQAVSGSQPAFSIPQYSFHSGWELPLYFGLGILSGPLSALYIFLIVRFRAYAHRLALPAWVKPALAGVIVGIVGIFLPQVFGVGYETISGILKDESFSIGFLIILMLAKLLMTPTSIAGGFVGGVFAPALFLGATLGGAFGRLAEGWFPGLTLSPGAFAMVGMAAVLAGVVRAPLTAILLLFEMTNDYRIILPLMFSVAISVALSRRFQPDSIYQQPLAANGLRLQGGKDVDVLDQLRVEEVMSTDLTALRADQSIETALDFLVETHHHGLPVLSTDDQLIGMLTLSDIESWKNQEDSPALDATSVRQVCTQRLTVAAPAERISSALQKMSEKDLGRLPVVDPAEPNRLVGMLRRNDVIHAYDMALARRAIQRHRAAQTSFDLLTGAEIKSCVIENNSACDQRLIKDIPWPQGVIVTSVRRRGKIITPHGNTRLLAGDQIILSMEPGSFPQAASLIHGNPLNLRETPPPDESETHKSPE